MANTTAVVIAKTADKYYVGFVQNAEKLTHPKKEVRWRAAAPLLSSHTFLFYANAYGEAERLQEEFGKDKASPPEIIEVKIDEEKGGVSRVCS
jgi:hypothetical protein